MDAHRGKGGGKARVDCSRIREHTGKARGREEGGGCRFEEEEIKIGWGVRWPGERGEIPADADRRARAPPRHPGPIDDPPSQAEPEPDTTRPLVGTRADPGGLLNQLNRSHDLLEGSSMSSGGYKYDEGGQVRCATWVG